ncbi:MarR family winged helix-turn-helix transcriptional regulator [Rhizobium halophilum]|uniref:MarR family winged helix-turn-helix transcriptional regulator n=1 Tax=Rhizobium halophilum TaxID=2846852 RepID=UPI001EFCC98B|nr:MarR family transcriptional regulator [Rhizobium halophilum]MCF6370364.1 MarR family transcriptional regulator [Rhizobium halophilum]
MSNSMPIPFSTTIHVRDTCLCLHVQRAARALARRFDNALKPLGINNGQFSLMMALNRPQPAPMGPVAELLAMDRTTLTAALKVLERRGLVETLLHPDDKRSRLMKLTKEGHSLLSSALPIWQRVHGELDVELGEDMDPLRRALATIR